jgi:hypothetical protein
MNNILYAIKGTLYPSCVVIACKAVVKRAIVYQKCHPAAVIIPFLTHVMRKAAICIGNNIANA